MSNTRKRTLLSEEQLGPCTRTRLVEQLAHNGDIDNLSASQKAKIYFSVVTSGDNQYLLSFLQKEMDPGYYYPEVLMRCVTLLPESEVYLRSLLSMRKRYIEHERRLRHVMRDGNIDPEIIVAVSDMIGTMAQEQAQAQVQAHAQAQAWVQSQPWVQSWAQAQIPEVTVLAVHTVFPAGGATAAVMPSMGVMPQVVADPVVQQQGISDYDAGYVQGEGIQAPMVSYVSVDDKAGGEPKGDEQHFQLLNQMRTAEKTAHVHRDHESEEDELSGNETDEEELRRDYEQQTMD